MLMARIYTERLIKRVMELSHGNDWNTAVTEWEIADCEEDSTLSESCICGKEHLYYLFTIINTVNGNELFPIGSSCIKKFGRDDLDNEASVREKMFKLYHAVENNRFISLSPEFFSRKLLRKLLDEGAFDCEYNDYDMKYCELLGCEELTSTFCLSDDRVYGNMCGITFERHGTIGRGSDKCDFYFYMD